MTVATSSSDVLYESDNGISRLSINRPERLNALTWDAVRELRSRVAAVKADPLARVLVLAGIGEKAFCAGADLSGMAPDTGFLENHDARGELAALMSELWSLGKPTIARIQGFALAGGFGLALACDLVVASTEAKFGAPEVNVGLWPYMITVPILRSMPPKKALELMLTGRIVGAKEAEEIGFVTRLVAPEDLDDAVGDLARQISSKSPAILRLGRDSFYKVLDMNSDNALAHLHAMLTLTTMTEDAAEGIAAFRQKRPPHWSGK
ncbi:MAG: enoyl-CoA hydratase-related protein [Actinomycetota bacterium]|jgi:enoyl-CoA hydratase/carnithine racemase|nr:enoyl-CoA hydratase-related protein [Actinomycetota bacterium]